MKNMANWRQVWIVFLPLFSSEEMCESSDFALVYDASLSGHPVMCLLLILLAACYHCVHRYFW